MSEIRRAKEVVTTRKHSSRMRTVPTSVATTRCQYQWGCSSSSEQVWTGFQWWLPDVSGRGASIEQGVVGMVYQGVVGMVYQGVGYVTYPMIHVRYLPPPPVNRQIPVKTLPSRNFVREAVIRNGRKFQAWCTCQDFCSSLDAMMQWLTEHVVLSQVTWRNFAPRTTLPDSFN